MALSPRQTRAKAIHEARRDQRRAERARREALESIARHSAIATELLDRHMPTQAA